MNPPGNSRDVESAIQGVEVRLRAMNDQLHGEYGTPRLGNHENPTDEFGYIVLSRKTAERAYVPAFEALKKLGDWAFIKDLEPQAIEHAIRGGGLERKKAEAIREGLRTIAEAFGSPDLAMAESMGDDDLFAFIASLPEVGPKSALCIMLYSFGRAVFPVDAHVGRVLGRTEVFRPLGVDLAPMNHKQKQRNLRNLVPPDLRYGLHVNLVVHGRKICRAVGPKCGECVFKSWCSHVAMRQEPSE